VSDFDGHIATINADGSNRNVIFSTNLPIVSMSVCTETGQVLMAMPNTATQGVNIFRMDVEGGKLTPLTKGKFEQNAVCSSDGKFLVYTTLINGKQFVMRMPTDGGQAVQLSDQFAWSATISPDGQQVAMVTVEGQGTQIKTVIKVIPATGGAPVRSLDAPTAMTGSMQFSADGKAIYYPITEKGVSNLVSRPLDGGPPTQVTDFKELTGYGFAYNWPANKLAVTRGKPNNDVVIITQQAAQ
jgi:Tol biopolymer transport system component